MRRALIVALAAVAAWLSVALWHEVLGTVELSVSAQAAASEGGSRRVPAELVRVVDGDTIVVTVEGREERIRYIGIDTPELHHPRMPVMPVAREAKRANEELLSGGRIALAFDVEKRDRYGRLLAYVFVTHGSGLLTPDSSPVFVNLSLVEMGLARCYTFPPNVAYVDEFVAAQKRSRKKELGVWRDYEASFGKPFDESNPEGRYRRR